MWDGGGGGGEGSEMVVVGKCMIYTNTLLNVS